MSDPSAYGTEVGERIPPWRVLEDELTSLDLEAPLSDGTSADRGGFEQLYTAAAKTASGQQTAIYNLLGVICSFHFRPTDKIEPFSNQWSMGGQRSLQGSDFDRAQIEALNSSLPRFENLALKTRIADLIWTRDKGKSECARIARDGYVALALSLLRGHATDRFDRDPALGMTTQNYLARAGVIARQIGWPRDENDLLRSAILEAVDLAKSRDPMALVRFGRLAVDHGLGITDDRLINLDELASGCADQTKFHEAESLQKFSILLAAVKAVLRPFETLLLDLREFLSARPTPRTARC